MQTLNDHFGQARERLDVIVVAAEREGREHLADVARQLRHDAAALQARFESLDLAGDALIGGRSPLGAFADDVALRLATARHAVNELARCASHATVALRHDVDLALDDLVTGMDDARHVLA